MNIQFPNFEKQVYDWLLAKHQKDNSFCFSTRRKAAKGAERNYFIGTEKSNYFGTTFWFIPISFPGSSNDLINVIFTIKQGKYHCYIQFGQTRNPANTQNALALKFIQELKIHLKANNYALAWENEASKKMEYYNITLCNLFDDITAFFDKLESELNRIIPIIDSFINSFKGVNPRFEVQKIDDVSFNKVYQQALISRLKKYAVVGAEAQVKVVEIETKTEKPQDTNFDHALNTILYGPPGTGKTYNSIEMALQIVDPEYYHENSGDREKINDRFNELLFKDLERETDAQIGFCTFHQSFNYEDFIEGIKPRTIENKVHYEVQDGIFKRIAYHARKNFQNSLQENSMKEDFDVALQKLREDWEKDPDMKFSMKTKGYEYTIIGFTDYSIRYKKASGGTGHTLSIDTLEKYYYGTIGVRKTGVGIYYPGVIEKLNSYPKTTTTEIERKNYVLIIDEINRGNVSQIFGELITSIESSKRMGNKAEEIEVILPYSKMSFSVPPNLYIIGTMNTADRSVEALDTALRRRFKFEEKGPDTDVIQDLFEEEFIRKCAEFDRLNWDHPDWKKIEARYVEIVPAEAYARFIEIVGDRHGNTKEISAEEYKHCWDIAAIKLITVSILEVINERIEMLLSRDSLIGHSFFINVYTYEGIKNALFKNIIPLLQEYFYGDYGKIGLVLGSGFVEKQYDASKKVVKFADFDYEDKDDLQKTVYRLKPYNKVNIQDAINALFQTEKAKPSSNGN